MFDEDLPWRVASALRKLGFRRCYYVGYKASPVRGSSDEDVLGHAMRSKRTIVTSNLDMILLCVEKGHRVIWIDPRGREFRFEEMVILVLKNIDDWAERLNMANELVCLQAMRTKTETLKLDEASRRARIRIGQMRTKKETLDVGEAGRRVRNRMSRISQAHARRKRIAGRAETLPGLG